MHVTTHTKYSVRQIKRSLPGVLSGSSEEPLWCNHVGFLIAAHKVEGPATRLAFLGILIDTERGTLSLPADKLTRLKAEITRWRGRKFCKKRELLSLIGQSQHAFRVVRAGRTAYNRFVLDGQRTRSLVAPQLEIPFGSPVVGPFHRGLERRRIGTA